jgi:endoglucanase
MDLELLKELCDAPGVPGHEENIRKIVKRELKELSDEIIIDPMGNAIFMINGKSGATILVDAHMDEVGFIVSHVEESGLIRVIPLGGIDGDNYNPLNTLGVVGYT